MKACGERFAELAGVRVVTTKGIPASWIGRAREDADLIYGGAEYMLLDYDRECPGLVDMNTVVNLYPRRVGLLVRKGNPRGLDTIEDLGREGLRVLDVQLEKTSVSLGGKADGRLMGGPIRPGRLRVVLGRGLGVQTENDLSRGMPCRNC